MSGRLAGRVSIITGATSGIGRATALAFAAEGARLILTGRRERLGQDVQAHCRHIGADCRFVAADHTRMPDCEAVVAAALAEFGRIDILFNNAGIVTRGTALTTSETVWHETLELNVTAVWRMCRLVIPHMQRQGGGAIVNNGSDWSVVGGRDALPYVVSKGAVAQMTKAMALDHARDGIRVNAVCPGDTEVERWRENPQAVAHSSDYLPMQRFGRPEEVANAVIFLASDESSFMTGHLLLVDGGNTAQ